VKLGTIKFLMKPSRGTILVDAVNAGSRRTAAAGATKLICGCDEPTNKKLAVELGLSETAVKVHQSQAPKMIKAASIIELVRVASRLRASWSLI
jgi:FixJ family two-component response regulator